MDTITLDAAVRASTVKSNGLRKEGRVPAVYYGAGVKHMSLSVVSGPFRKCFDKAGENTIVQLMVDGKAHPVLIHQVQFHPVSDAVAHVDFIHVDMNKEVTTSVKVTFVGVAPAVKTMGGVLDIQKHELKIKCLPKDLIHSIEVDVSSILDFHSPIHVKDVVIPATIKVLDNADDTVVSASAMKIEKEETPVAAAAVAGEAGAAAAPAADGAAAPAAAAAPEAKK